MEKNKKDGTGSKIDAIVYSEMTGEGSTPVAWISTRDISDKELLSISLKSIALLSFDDIAKISCKDPKYIVGEENSFGIIPFPDFDGTGVSYIFNYAGTKEQNVICTITIVVPSRFKNFLFEKHESIEKLMKFTAFEILKIALKRKKDYISDFKAQLTLLYEKLNRLDH